MIFMKNIASLKENQKHGSLEFGFSCYQVYKKSKPILLRDHWHPELEILLITSGKGILHLESSYQLVQKGNLIIFRPNQLHGMTWQKPNSDLFSFDALVFNPDFLKSYSSDIVETNEIQPIIDERYNMKQVFTEKDSNFQSLFRAIVAAHQNQPRFFQMEIKGLLFILLRNILLAQDKPTIRQSRTTAVNNARAKIIVDYIHNNFQSKLTLTKMASLIDVSTSTFCRFFIKNFNDTFSNYLTKLRLANAMEDLQNTPKSITTVALDNGFESSSYFSYAFKKINGVSPSKFKLNLATTNRSIN